MSQVVVHRPPRSLPPDVPGEEIRLEAPPELPRGRQDSVLMQLLPTLGMASSMVYFFMPGAAPMMKIMGVMMMCSTLGMTIAMVVRHRQGSQGQTADMRRDYLKYLAQTRRTVRRTARAQRDAQFYLPPPPTSCGRSSRRAPGCGSGARATTTSGRSASGWGRSSSRRRWWLRRPLR